MDNFQSIGLLVTEARNLLDSIKGGAIRVMQTQFDALIQTLTGRFNTKLTEYQTQVSAVTKPSTDVIKSSMSQKLHIDPINGNDNNSGLSVTSAFKTLQAAIASTPDTCSVDLHIINDANSYLVIDKPVFIKSRAIFIKSGFISMVNCTAFIGDFGSIRTFPGQVTFKVSGKVLLLHSSGKSVLCMGGYEGQLITLSNDAELSFIGQSYSTPAGMAEVFLHRVSCVDELGNPTAQKVTMLNIMHTAATVANLWSCSFGSNYAPFGGTGSFTAAKETNLSGNLRIISN